MNFNLNIKNDYIINDTTASTQGGVRCIKLLDGSLCYTWQSFGNETSGDTGLYGVFTKIYNVDGSVRVPETQVNVYEYKYQLTPTLIEFGDYIYYAYVSSSEGESNNIRLRALNINDNVFTDEFIVGTKQNNCMYPKLRVSNDKLMINYKELNNGKLIGYTQEVVYDINSVITTNYCEYVTESVEEFTELSPQSNITRILVSVVGDYDTVDGSDIHVMTNGTEKSVTNVDNHIIPSNDNTFNLDGSKYNKLVIGAVLGTDDIITIVGQPDITASDMTNDAFEIVWDGSDIVVGVESNIEVLLNAYYETTVIDFNLEETLTKLPLNTIDPTLIGFETLITNTPNLKIINDSGSKYTIQTYTNIEVQKGGIK